MRVIGLLAGAVALWSTTSLFSPASQVQNAAQEVKDGGAPSASVNASRQINPRVFSRPPVSAVLPRKSRPISGAQSAIGQDFASAPSLKAFFDTYATNWQSASAEVQYYLAKALAHCTPFIGADLDRHPRPPLLSEAAKKRPHYAERAAALEKLKADCAGFEKFQMPEGMLEDLRRGASAGNFPGAKAMRLPGLQRAGNVEDARAGLEAVLSDTIDVEAINGIANYLSAIHADVRVSDPPYQPTRELYQDAWRLVMCDFGLDCRAGSRSMTLLCLQTGLCGVGSYEEYLARHRYGPAAFEELSRIRLQLISGLTRRDAALLGIPRK